MTIREANKFKWQYFPHLQRGCLRPYIIYKPDNYWIGGSANKATVWKDAHIFTTRIDDWEAGTVSYFIELDSEGLWVKEER